MLGILFVILGIIAIVFNKPLARLFSEYQKQMGWKNGAYSFGRYMNIIMGIIFLLIGLMELVVRQK